MADNVVVKMVLNHLNQPDRKEISPPKAALVNVYSAPTFEMLEASSA